MHIYFIGVTADVIGKVLVVLVTLRIHVKHFKVHRVNQKDVRLDVALTLLGLFLILLGYALRIPQDISIVY
ncbi:hypothetical protein CO173_03610 [Candidatus Uhrbacteria bacterium CG_4_9_14_3_um_filter_41_35]|uniref:Uncharacterized protein n=1 Tax=Candidatus Uhrbacteria bacterium CG_4_9_14_3_um_filter_41_35 TaxID=1975034 RepID=A0A2M7XDY3_9BACT|nr:MAG: hypothetical protein COV92_02140 [Candidatus Uhrbacteria bacterium CG11_big_fil_rev_8_21_14_0_20_41_9]PJA46100.1 MAG: hypothetical protein CO173_03610 [Candidatus Uhrbacteria bacterium CG_4_9_14_3_um_filter_41_35]